jgi:hypothetical protein
MLKYDENRDSKTTCLRTFKRGKLLLKFPLKDNSWFNTYISKYYTPNVTCQTVIVSAIYLRFVVKPFIKNYRAVRPTYKFSIKTAKNVKRF